VNRSNLDLYLLK